VPVAVSRRSSGRPIVPVAAGRLCAEADPAERAMRLLAQVAARTLVERHVQRRRVVRAQAREREATPKASPEHG